MSFHGINEEELNQTFCRDADRAEARKLIEQAKREARAEVFREIEDIAPLSCADFLHSSRYYALKSRLGKGEGERAMRLSDLQAAVKEWSSRNFPTTDPVDPLLGVGEETGELMHHYLKRKQGIRGTFEEHTAQIEDAVGDITVYLADFCWRNGLDYQQAVETVWSKVSKRDWLKNKQNGESGQMPEEG